MDQIVSELGELIEDDVLVIARELRALVVDFLDVALGPRRADDVGGLADPLRQPLETLTAHARRQNSNAAAAEDAGDGDTAAAVVACGRPDGAMMLRIEQPGHQPRHQTRIGGEDLVRADHREAPAQQYDNGRLHAGQCLRQDDVPRHLDALPAIGGVEPVNPPEILLIGRIRID